LTLPSATPHAPLPIDVSPLAIGTEVAVWGHPLGYNGPAPLLTAGYLAGFNDHGTGFRRLVINAAINPGNSGGPIVAMGMGSVRGVAVSKHAPIHQSLLSAIEALRANTSGIVFHATDAAGKSVAFVESQLVAELLMHFRDMTQVVIGEAIEAADVVRFLDDLAVPWTPTAK
jgi:S1-C subfamily serine protease